MQRFLAHFRSIHRGSFFTEMRSTSGRKLLPEAWGALRATFECEHSSFLQMLNLLDMVLSLECGHLIWTSSLGIYFKRLNRT